MKLFPPRRSTLRHADGHEAGQQNPRVPQVPGEAHGPAGVGECEQQTRGRLRVSQFMALLCLLMMMVEHVTC